MLVIIGLLVGGVLVGRNLIDASAVRAEITQIEKYNTAVNTFRGKYGYLPGDIPDPTASQFGFQTRGLYAGEGDGNGVIEGNVGNNSGQNYYGIGAIVNLGNACPQCLIANMALTVQQAYNINKKMDDGLPQSGNVTAMGIRDQNVYWSNNGYTAAQNTAPWTGYSPAATTSCFDNGGSLNGAPLQYSVSTSANYVNCILSFKFQ